MTHGFSFMGLHSSLFGVYYVPDSSSMFDDGTDMTVYDEDAEWQDGGIYYGKKMKQREFELSCFYEDLDEKGYQKMRQWLDTGNSGKLIFDTAPWKYYDAVVTKKLNGKKYCHRAEDAETIRYSGTFTMTMTAYQPYAKMLYQELDGMDTDGVSKVCGILPHDQMPTAPTASDRRFILYNCGLITTPCVIRLGGTVDEDGLSICNETTGQECILRALPPSPAYLEIDSETGSVRVIDPTSSTNEMAFEYHDAGYVSLAPGGFLYDSMMVTYLKGNNTLTVNRDEASASYVGKYIYIEGKWARILHVNGREMVISENMLAAGVSMVTPVTMNTIDIRGNATLDRLEIDWNPLVK